MKESTYYNYKELVEKAIAIDATRDDRLALLDWFDRYGVDYWHGEYYAMEDGTRLYPIYQGVGEQDEDGSFDDYDLVDAEIRF